MSAKDKTQTRFRQVVLDLLWDIHNGRRQPPAALISIEVSADKLVAAACEPLVAALKAVEWIDCVVSVGEGDEDSWRECPICRNLCEQGHAPDCPLAAALAAKETP